MDVSRQAISRWETGLAIPSSENLKYLDNLYDVSLDYLFNDNEDEPKQNKEKTVTAPDPVDTGKKNERKLIKWVVIALALLGLIVAACIFVVVGDGNFVSIKIYPQRR